MFSTKMGTPISPNNVLRRFIFRACKRLGLPEATWLTFRRTYSSWSHDRGVAGKVVAQLMGHANVKIADGNVKVLDFGLAKATTPDWMLNPGDRRSDEWHDLPRRIATSSAQSIP